MFGLKNFVKNDNNTLSPHDFHCKLFNESQGMYGEKVLNSAKLV
jgi:hypothetical protein